MASASHHLPRLVIGAPQGRSGKTTVTLGLCAAFVARGLTVQPFKKGPDYIDPSWLTEAAGRPCRTLDPFFHADDASLVAAFGRGALGADISVIEGNHGLYDGVPLPQRNTEETRTDASVPSVPSLPSVPSVPSLPSVPSIPSLPSVPSDSDAYSSTAHVARLLHAPIILVVNAARMSRSIAALVRGFQTFEPDTPIAGVILNNTARPGPALPARHATRLRDAVERHCGIPVLGILPRDETLTIPDRHLGLVPRGEDDGLIPALAACRHAAEKHLDLDAILAIARQAPLLVGAGEDEKRETKNEKLRANSDIRNLQSAIRLGVFRDRAFTFYYPENLEALTDAGAELVFIDAFTAPRLPAIAALYIGGGFPEIFMEALSANAALRGAVRAAAADGLPIYAECGGLMYLARRLTWGTRSAEMAGVLPCDVEMTDRPQGHGYVIAEALAAHPFLPAGTVVRGHEFHNSRLVNVDPYLVTAYHLTRGSGVGSGQDGGPRDGGRLDGLCIHNVLASYTHLHAAGAPGWAEGFIAAARVYASAHNQTGVFQTS